MLIIETWKYLYYTFPDFPIMDKSAIDRMSFGVNETADPTRCSRCDCQLPAVEPGKHGDWLCDACWHHYEQWRK